MSRIQLLLTLAALQMFIHAAAQVTDFAPVGAKWHYSEQAFAPPPFGEFPHVVEVVSKEIYQGKLCSKLIGIGSETVPDPLYVHSQNDSVFFYSLLSGKFELLYDFGTEPNESWVIGGLNTPEGLDSVVVQVDSVSQITVSGTALKVLYISCPYLFFDWGGEIIAGIGNTYFLTPDYGLYEGGPMGLRCYTDTQNDLHFVSYPCDTTIVTTNTVEVNKILPIAISPNPASTFAQLPFAPDHMQVFNMLGQSVRVSFSNETLDISALSPGIYQVLAEKDGVLYAGKLAAGR